MKKTILTILVCICFGFVDNFVNIAHAKPPKNQKSKFYNFDEQLIDGEIRKPTTLYINSRDRVKFARLLKLKKSFLPKLFATSKHKIFK